MKQLLLILAFAATMVGQNIAGTYSGTMKHLPPDTQDDEQGVVIVKNDAGKLDISAGPNGDEQMPARNIELKGESLKFELNVGGDGPKSIKFDMTVKDNKMTGTITLTRPDGSVSKAMLDLKRQ